VLLPKQTGRLAANLAKRHGVNRPGFAGGSNS
jgi:hypothetical protein